MPVERICDGALSGSGGHVHSGAAALCRGSPAADPGEFRICANGVCAGYFTTRDRVRIGLDGAICLCTGVGTHRAICLPLSWKCCGSTEVTARCALPGECEYGFEGAGLLSSLAHSELVSRGLGGFRCLRRTQCKKASPFQMQKVYAALKQKYRQSEADQLTGMQ